MDRMRITEPPVSSESAPTGYRESRKPACTFPLSDYIWEELGAREWTVDDLVDESELSGDQILSILNGSPVTEAIAKGLARAFGTSHELWLNLGRDGK